MKLYLKRLWYALLGMPLPFDREVIQGGGGPIDPGKPK